MQRDGEHEAAGLVDYNVEDREGGTVVLALKGDLTSDADVGRLHEALKDKYVDDGVVRISIDLADLERLDLEGVAMLLSLHERARDQGKQFVLEHPRGQVAEKLQTTGLWRLLVDQDPPAN